MVVGRSSLSHLKSRTRAPRLPSHSGSPIWQEKPLPRGSCSPSPPRRRGETSGQDGEEQKVLSVFSVNLLEDIVRKKRRMKPLASHHPINEVLAWDAIGGTTRYKQNTRLCCV